MPIPKMKTRVEKDAEKKVHRYTAKDVKITFTEN